MHQTALTPLSAPVWQERMAAHRARAMAWTQPMRDRRARRESHPVLDFLHTYYSFSFGKLEQWHPGLGVTLQEAPDLPRIFKRPPYQRSDNGLHLDTTHLPDKKRKQLTWIHHLLVGTQHRPPNFACHGLHEWAMVYSGAEIRHRETVPLRLPQEAIDEIFGENSPVGEPGDVIGPGNTSGGRACSWARGTATLRVSIFIRPGFLTPMEICDYCETIDGYGDEAWAGESDRGSGGSLIAISVGGLGVQLSADGLGVTVEQLEPIAAAVLAGMP